jgi:electron transfer flavoprotein beta subunit
MGADKAVHVLQKGLLTGKPVTPLLLAAIERLGGADLILAGLSGDMDPIGPVAGRLAAALDRQLIMDVLSFEPGPEGLWAIGGCDGGAVRVPVALPAVALVMAGPERPRYPHPSRIAVAWNEGYVETITAEDLGVAEEQLALDAEMGNLVLGPERQRGQVLRGGPAEAAGELVGILAGKGLL